jgi:hypothetical protein
MARSLAGKKVFADTLSRKIDLGVVLRVNELDPFLGDDVVQYSEVLRVVRWRDQVSRVGLCAMQVVRTRISAHYVERLGGLP